MKNMKEQLFSIGERIGEKLISGIGETSIKISEQARSKCVMLGIYEPKFPLDLIKENIEK